MSEPGILPEPIPFGKYYLLERINVGGMAEVYKAKAFGVEGFERLLAIKKILDNIAEDESFIDMFIDEAKIAGQLNHPNIAQIFDLGQVDGSYFIALEYISGKDLKTQFERARRIGEEVSIPRICYTIMKVCEGLGHAHEKKDPQGNDLNIVHRDVSPQNILTSYEGEVKIIDFGIAKAQGKTSQTQVGILKGKFSYMSPEQVRGLHVDHRSDIFSLGIVLYEMLTLERLFLGESDFDTLEKIRKVEMSPPSLYNPHIPKELEDIVLKALARSPEDRYQSAYGLAEDLERFMRNEGYYYTNKDLADYMKEAFQADIEFEQKKLEYYRSLDLQPMGGPEEDEATPAADGFGWDDEEMETQIYSRDDDDDEAEEDITDSDIVYAEEVDEQPADDQPDIVYAEELDDQPADDQPDIVYADEPDPVVGDGAGDDEVTQIHVPGVSPGQSGPGLDDSQRGDNPAADSEQQQWNEELNLDSSAKGPQQDPDVEVQPRREPQATARVSAVDTSENKQVKVPESTASPRARGDSDSGGGLRIGVIAVVAAVTLGGGLAIYLAFADEDTEQVPEETAAMTVDAEHGPVTVLIDGEPIAEDVSPPVDIDELPGGEQLDLRVEHGYREPFETTETLEPGATGEITAELELPDLDDTGIEVTTDPEEATVYLEGNDVEQEETSPAEFFELTPGDYEIRAQLDGFHEESEQLEVELDETAEVDFQLRPTEIDLTITSRPDGSNFTLYDEDSDEQIDSGRTASTVSGLDADATYRVVVERRYYESAEELFEPGEDPEAEIHLRLDQDTEALAARDDDSDDEATGSPSPDPGGADPAPDPDPDPDPDPEPTGTGSVSVQSNPAARVYINGQDTGQYTPIRGHELPAGSHQIRLVNEDHGLEETYGVELGAGDEEVVIHR